jgi:hypothetical protein
MREVSGRDSEDRFNAAAAVGADVILGPVTY